jgi:hypothetical protein
MADCGHPRGRYKSNKFFSFRPLQGLTLVPKRLLTGVLFECDFYPSAPAATRP